MAQKKVYEVTVVDNKIEKVVFCDNIVAQDQGYALLKAQLDMSGEDSDLSDTKRFFVLFRIMGDYTPSA